MVISPTLVMSATVIRVDFGKAGVWDRIVDALAAGHDAAVQMIDTSSTRAPARSQHRGQQSPRYVSLARGLTTPCRLFSRNFPASSA
jgi:hypothetical protein